jgi:hypothetical protein
MLILLVPVTSLPIPPLAMTDLKTKAKKRKDIALVAKQERDQQLVLASATSCSLYRSFMPQGRRAIKYPLPPTPSSAAGGSKFQIFNLGLHSPSPSPITPDDHASSTGGNLALTLAETPPPDVTTQPDPIEEAQDPDHIPAPATPPAAAIPIDPVPPIDPALPVDPLDPVPIPMADHHIMATDPAPVIALPPQPVPAPVVAAAAGMQNANPPSPAHTVITIPDDSGDDGSEYLDFNLSSPGRRSPVPARTCVTKTFSEQWVADPKVARAPNPFGQT